MTDKRDDIIEITDEDGEKFEVEIINISDDAKKAKAKKK